MIIKEGLLKDDSLKLESLEVVLDGTTLLLISGYGAFAMCGALNVDVYNTEKMKDRKVICMRATGVRTIEDLYEARVVDCSNYAKEVGICIGMYVKDAFKKISIQ
ncbi:MAG: DUF1805 domain-containing protein [Anaeroplasma sp.]